MYKCFFIGMLLSGGVAAATAAPIDAQRAMQLAKEFMGSRSHEKSLLKQVSFSSEVFIR